MLRISKSLLQETIDNIKASTSKEKVLLWFGKKNNINSVVLDVYEPIQFAGRYYFEVPPEGIQKILDKVRIDKLIVVAQIHTHPGLAFHSRADDQMAIPRHVGAFSLVLPGFATNTNINNFQQQVVIYIMNSKGLWVKIDNNKIQVYE